MQLDELCPFCETPLGSSEMCQASLDFPGTFHYSCMAKAQEIKRQLLWDLVKERFKKQGASD